MTIIRVSCPTCGQIELPSDRIELVSIPGRPVDRGNPHYTFTCAICDTVVRRPADRTAMAILTSAGVAVRAPRHPVFGDGPGHPEHPPAGPAFTPDDVLDLHLLLDGGTWLDDLLAVDRDPA